MPGAVAAGRVFDAEIRWLAHNRRSLGRKRALTLHLLGHRAQADVKADIEISPGDSGTARIRLKRTLPLPPGAHFVLRGDPTHGFGSVVGGGRILDAHPKGRRSGEQRIRLASGTIDDARSLLIQEAGEMGMSDEELILRLPLPWVQSTRIHFDEDARRRCKESLMRRIQAHHQEHPTELGPAQNALAVTPIERAVLGGMLDSNHLFREAGRVRLPHHTITVDPEQVKLQKKIMKSLRKSRDNSAS